MTGPKARQTDHEIDTRPVRSYNMPEVLGHRSNNWDFSVHITGISPFFTRSNRSYNLGLVVHKKMGRRSYKVGF